MSSSSKGIIVAVGGAVVLAVGFGVLYFAVLEPRAERKRVQEEVGAWGERWAKARTCLVGEGPRSSDGYEAVILRDALASADPTDELAACLGAIKELRPSTSYTAGAEVDAAWREVEKAWKALGQAHAWRTAKTPNRPLPVIREDLGRAVAAMDAAHARLRTAADLDPAPPAGEPLRALPDGQVIASPKGAPIESNEPSLSADAVAAVGSAGDQTWLVRLTSAGAESIPVGLEVLPAVDGGGWGVWVERPEDGEGGGGHRLLAGAIDAQGDASGEGVAIARAAGPLRPVFAAGAGADRVVAYMEDRGVVTGPDGYPQGRAAYVVVRSRDSGATWPERVVLTESPDASLVHFADPASRRFDAVWQAAGGLQWLALDAADLAGELRPVRLTRAQDRLHTAPCREGTRMWWPLDSGLHVTEGTGGPARPVPGSTPEDFGVRHTIRCGGERLIALADGDPGQRVQVCQVGGCAISSITSAVGANHTAAVTAGGGPLVAAELGGVLILWAGDPAKEEELAVRELVRLPEGHTLAGLVEWGGALHLVTRTAEALRVVPLGGA